MRRKKIMSVFGAMALTIASVAGCATGGNGTTVADVTVPSIEIPDVASQAEAKSLQHDDSTISDIQKACWATLSEEKYYVACNGSVQVRVSGDGTISVSGMNSETDNFLKEIYTWVTGTMTGPVRFYSKAYKEGGDTTFKFVFNNTLYTWSGTVYNSIEGSRYNRTMPSYDETQEVTGAQETEEDTKATESPKVIQNDDETIEMIQKGCEALITDAKYFNLVDDAVKVDVKVENNVGTISVDGLNAASLDFTKELYLLMDSTSGAIPFQSDAYEGTTTELTIRWNFALYTWETSIENDAQGSKYCKVTQATDPETQSTEAPNNGKTRIEVMAYTQEVPNMIKYYLATHPDFESEYDVFFTIVTTDNHAYQNALDYTLKGEFNDDHVPDLYVAESAFLKKYTTGSMSSYACTYEDLGIDVEQGIIDAGIAPYTADATRREGKVVALTYQGNGCAFIYNRDIARDVFGNDKPETVATALGNDWDSFFHAAELCKEKGYAIVSGDGDIWHAIENSADLGWVVDGKLYIDPKREAFLDYSMRLMTYDYHNDTMEWTQAWFDDMSEVGPKKVLGFYGPMWLLTYTLGDNGGDNYGHWGACRPNAASFWSGSWLVANKKVLENEKLKDGVRELIEFITLDTSNDGAQYLLANNMLFEYGGMKMSVPSRVVMEKSDGSLEILNGQDAYPIFIEAAENARGDNLTEYDEQINLYWRDAVRAYTSGECTRDEAIRWFKRIVQDSIPEITVE